MSENKFFLQFSKKCNGLLLPISFTLIILLMIFTSLLVTSKIKNSTDSMVSSVKKQNNNNSLLGKMSQSAFSRSILLVEMLRSDDPFKNDELFSELNTQGTIFAKARTIIKNQSNDKHLDELLSKQGELAHINAPLQSKIYEHIFNDEYERASSLFVSSALPTMKNHLSSINELVKYQLRQTSESVSKAENEITGTLSSIQKLNIISIIICIFLAFFVLKKKKDGERKLTLYKVNISHTLKLLHND